MSTFDDNGNLHGGDGRFAPQHKAEAGGVGLTSTEWKSLTPGDDVYREMRAIRDRVDNWQALLDAAEAVDLFVSEGDYTDYERERIRFVELELVDNGEGYKSYQATALDALGQPIGDSGEFDASPYGPEIPPEAFVPGGHGDRPKVIDIEKIRTYDWVHGQREFRDGLSDDLG